LGPSGPWSRCWATNTCCSSSSTPSSPPSGMSVHLPSERSTRRCKCKIHLTVFNLINYKQQLITMGCMVDHIPLHKKYIQQWTNNNGLVTFSFLIGFRHTLICTRQRHRPLQPLCRPHRLYCRPLHQHLQNQSHVAELKRYNKRCTRYFVNLNSILMITLCYLSLVCWYFSGTLKRIINTKVTKLESAKFSSFSKAIRQFPAFGNPFGNPFGSFLKHKFGN
jgi:hypothetical protein